MIFDVIVIENLFGDILSDEVFVIIGLFGMFFFVSYVENGLFLYELIYGFVLDIVN